MAEIMSLQKKCKILIASQCYLEIDKIKNEFEPILTDQEFALITNPDNWEWRQDHEEKNELLFNCEPLDDQLRAYVSLSDNPIAGIVGNHIKKIVIQRE